MDLVPHFQTFHEKIHAFRSHVAHNLFASCVLCRAHKVVTPMSGPGSA